jgi:hypothetical protein
MNKRPIESDYISQVAYTRALEAYCDRQDRIRRAEEAFEASQQNIQSYLEKDIYKREWVWLMPMMSWTCGESAVGSPNEKYPLQQSDWLNFSQAIEAKLKEKNT